MALTLIKVNETKQTVCLPLDSYASNTGRGVYRHFHLFLIHYSTANSETRNSELYALELRHVSATSFQEKTYIK
jgi:hypothetical protein